MAFQSEAGNAIFWPRDNMQDLPCPNQTALKKDILRRLSASDAEGWLAALDIRLEDGVAHVGFPHSFFGPWFLRHWRVDFENAVRAALDPAISFVYETPDAPPPASGAYAGRQWIAEDFLAHDFDTFISDAENSAALEAAKKIAGQRGEPAFNPLVMHGPSGSGKSHLLRAIARGLSASRRPGRVLCAPASRFCHEYPYPEHMPELFWQDHEALLLDDVQDIGGNDALQRLIVLVLDACPRSSATALGGIYPMVFTLDRAPSRAGLCQRLATRLASGLAVETHEPDLGARLALLQRLAAQRGLDPGRDALMALARASAQPRSLEGFWRRLEAFARLRGRFPSGDELERLILGEHEKAPAFAELLEDIASQLGLTCEEILGHGRKASVARARQLAMYVCRLRLGLSYPELGRLFGGRDHTTVLHAVKKIEKMIRTNKDMNNLVTKLSMRAGIASHGEPERIPRTLAHGRMFKKFSALTNSYDAYEQKSVPITKIICEDNINEACSGQKQHS